MAKAYRHVGLAAENVDHFVAEGEVDDDVRVAGAECCHQGNDGQPPMAEGGADPQSAPWYALVGDGFFDLGHVGQDPSGAPQERLALCGESDRTGGSQQQAGTKTLLGTRDDPTDRRGCQPQCTRGGRQAAFLRHGGEHGHFTRLAAEVHLCPLRKGDCQKCYLPLEKAGS
ncbi:hypothetical protein D3C81_1612940 [compost metagenome]